MHYSIRHVTLFRYSNPVRESIMELRMQPRSEGQQALRSFQISTSPRAQLYAYTDHSGNAIYHFNVLREHSELRIEANSVVATQPARALPAHVDTLEWQRYNSLNLSGEHYDLLENSEFARMTPALQEFMAANDLMRPLADPLTALSSVMGLIWAQFEYDVAATEVHSPIEDALRSRRGVCQDFTHIMIAIARAWGIPARYVSGYLFHRSDHKDRSAEDATHAWVEAWLPSLGWVGFDPTNNVYAEERHIRVAIGRDYADVPPTRGTFKGAADSELSVAVTVAPTSAPVRHEEFLRVARPATPRKDKRTAVDDLYQQQQQQQ
jgi:transglutaminase-like putative cysteine protease